MSVKVTVTVEIDDGPQSAYLRVGIDTWIDGQPAGRGELRIWQTATWVRSERATKPDPRWSHTDSRGHYHAFAGTGLPTLRSAEVPVPCDGSCGGTCGGEGYTRTEYTCLACGEIVKPSHVPDRHASWEARVRGTAAVLAGLHPDGRTQVSVVMDRRAADPVRYFGFAVVGSSEREGGFTGPDMCTVTLHGLSELGQGAVFDAVTAVPAG